MKHADMVSVFYAMNMYTTNKPFHPQESWKLKNGKNSVIK